MRTGGIFGLGSGHNLCQSEGHTGAGGDPGGTLKFTGRQQRLTALPNTATNAAQSKGSGITRPP
jgi:hypothetical protein